MDSNVRLPNLQWKVPFQHYIKEIIQLDYTSFINHTQILEEKYMFYYIPVTYAKTHKTLLLAATRDKYPALDCLLWLM